MKAADYENNIYVQAKQWSYNYNNYETSLKWSLKQAWYLIINTYTTRLL